MLDGVLKFPIFFSKLSVNDFASKTLVWQCEKRKTPRTDATQCIFNRKIDNKRGRRRRSRNLMTNSCQNWTRTIKTKPERK